MSNNIKKGHVILLFLLLGISLIVYQDFLVGKNLFFVNSVDTTTNFLPNLINLHNIIYSGEFPMWSFAKGLGSQVTTGNPSYLGDFFALCTVLLPRSVIPYAIGLFFVLKVVFAGLLFYVYLREFKVFTVNQRIMGALFYAFNGHMLCRGAWSHYATEVIMVSIWLIGLEKWYNKTNRLLFPITLALLLISRSASYVYLYSLFSFAYVTIRYIFDNGLSWKGLFKTILYFIPAYLLGLGLSAFLVLPGLVNILRSGRLGNDGFSFAKLTSGFKLERVDKTMLALLKTFAPNITGIFATPQGNILEDACFYGGIPSIIFISTITGNKNIERKKKNVLYMLILLVVLYMILIWPKGFLNAFMLHAVKTSSFWINIVIIMIGLYALARYDYRTKAMLGRNFFLIICFLSIIYFNRNNIIDTLYIGWIAILLWLAYLILLCYNEKNKKTKYMFLLVCCLEIIIFAKISVIFVSDFPVYTEDDLKKYYQEYSALEDLNSDEFYRVAIENDSYFYHNLSMLYNYAGLKEYDSLLPSSLLEVKDFFDLETPNNNLFFGAEKRIGLKTILSTKYIVSHKDELNNEYGNCQYYKDLDSEQKLFAYKVFYPFGFTYKNKIAKNKIKDLPAEIKDTILLQAAILEPEDYDSIALPEYQFSVDRFSISSEMIDRYSDISIEDTSGNCIKYTCTGDDPQIIFQIPMQTSGSSFIEVEVESNIKHNGQIFYAKSDYGFGEGQSMPIEIFEGKHKYQVGFNEEEFDQIRFDFGRNNSFISIQNIAIKRINSLHTGFQEYVNKLQISSFENNRIEGVVYNSSDEFLFLSIPFEKGWKLQVNGEDKEILRTNIGFCGVELVEGKNIIELTYITPGLQMGCTISAICSIIYLICIMNCLKKQGLKNGFTIINRRGR